MLTFFQVVNEAINDIKEHGFDSLTRIQNWADKIRNAALKSLVPQAMLEKTMRSTFERIYSGLITKGGYTKIHPGIERFGVERLTPKLREMLSQRKAMSANLIKLNRDKMIEQTNQRFQGWASSVPPGGSTISTRDTQQDIGKALKSLPFEERRVMIDQGHKFVASLNNVIATDNNAIGCTWHSHWRQAGYNYRKDHKERDLKVYLLKGNWAQAAGFIKLDPDAGYYDDITKAAEEPFCRCAVTYIYTIGAIPESMLTEKGKAELIRVRKAVVQLRKPA